jgi:hypothetical protein
LIELDDLLRGARGVREERIATRRVDHVLGVEARIGSRIGCVGRPGENADHALSFAHGPGHRPRLADVDALRTSVIEEQLVELGALDLEGVIALVPPRAVEREAILPSERVVVEARAVFLDERRLDLIEHADRLEHGERLRQQGLAQVEARELGLFEEQHLHAALREARRAYRSARATAHDHHIELFTHRVLPSSRQLPRRRLGICARAGSLASFSPRSSGAGQAGSARRCTHRST